MSEVPSRRSGRKKEAQERGAARANLVRGARGRPRRRLRRAAFLVPFLVIGLSIESFAQSIPQPVARDVARKIAASSATSLSEPAESVLEGAVDPAAYVLGPGDLLEVVYTGRAQPSEKLRVTPSGKIHLAPTGPAIVAGLTLAQAEEHLRQVLSRFYADTRISVDLLEVRTFRVHILGHVNKPGAYILSAASRASDLVKSQEGHRDRSSLRNMTLRRTNGNELHVDLVRYELLGDLAANPYLEDGDVLYVPAKRDSVSVFGRVPRPGFFEFRDGDAVDDLVALAGGLDSGADADSVELRRFGDEDSETTIVELLDIAEGGGALSARPGDAVYVRSRPEGRRERRVELRGEVRYPGAYSIEKDRDTLASLIERAGGFTEDADPNATQVTRPNVFDRPEDDPEFRRLQAIPITEMNREEFEYLKLRSRQREGLASSVLSARLGEPGGEGADLILRKGDVIEVPSQNLAVDVQGAVKNPGFVTYHPSLSARDYIDLAGGNSEKARTGQTRIIRGRTGEWVKADGETPVLAGDLVWVPERPDRDWWRITRETAVFLAQIGTLVVIIDSVNNR